MATGDISVLRQAAKTVSQMRLNGVYPELTNRYWQMEVIMFEQHSQVIRVAEGLRTSEYQNSLFAKGRTVLSDVGCTHGGRTWKPGTCPQHPLGATVTNAPGGHSYHNFGLAIDVDPIEKDRTIDWNASHPQWKLMEKTGVALGLDSGASWKRIVDAPHFQITGRFPEGAPTDELRSLLEASSFQGVWDAVAGTNVVTMQS